MRFTLTYDGLLPPSANKPKPRPKWEIRKQLHPQLVRLWKTHPALVAVEDNRHFPKARGTVLRQVHHQYPGPILVPRSETERYEDVGILDLCEPLEKGGRLFVPLVRETYALHCGLKVLFLRQEAPGKVYQGGDIDGRIKTLLDALAMPQHPEQVLADADAPNPIYCLLEDDSMVSGLNVETERLLTTNESPDWVRLVVEVDVRVRMAAIYNQSFLG